MHNGYEREEGQVLKCKRVVHLGSFEHCPVCSKTILGSFGQSFGRTNSVWKYLHDFQETRELRQYRDMWE